MKKSLFGFISIAMIFICSGCAPFLIGAGTVGVGADTIRLERFTNMDIAWQAATEVLNEQNAEISAQDKEKGTLNAVIDNHEVNIEIQTPEANTMAINIRARKKGLPALSFADSLAEKINEKISAAKKAAQEKTPQEI